MHFLSVEQLMFVYSFQHQLQFNLVKENHLSLQAIAEVLYPPSLFCALPQCHLSCLQAGWVLFSSPPWPLIEDAGKELNSIQKKKKKEKKASFTKMLLEMTERNDRNLHCAFQTGQLSSIKVLTFIVQTAKLLVPKLWDHFYFHTELSLERQRPWEAITQNHCCMHW